jgi:ornithine carbamoyltransferase
MDTLLRPVAAPTARTRHYLSTRDFSADETFEVLRLAQQLKRAHRLKEDRPLLAGRTLAMVFQKPSLRTRVSFEAGMTQLSGHAINLGPDDIQLGRRETVEDVALVLSRMADLVMARVFAHPMVEELARFATVPVINGLSDREHPCQVLGDLLTILERKDRLSGLRLAFVGEGNNVAHSLLYGAALMGIDCTVACPRGFEPSAAVLDDARQLAEATTAKLTVTPDLYDACRGADVVYTDVWVSMGQEQDAERRREALRAYRVDDALMSLAKPDAILLHCLPAHYGEEIDYATSRGRASAIFDQAENRLHAQKALMVRLAGAARPRGDLTTSFGAASRRPAPARM